MTNIKINGMDTCTDLLEEIAGERTNGKQSMYIDNLLDAIFHNGGYDTEKIEKEFHCQIYVSTEKHHQLQYTHYYTITSELINGELHLEIGDGIDSGTELYSYSFYSSIEPKSRTVEILKDIILDEDAYINSRFSVDKARVVFPRYKSEIWKLIKDQNYDNYVTGGGTNVTDKHYDSKFNELTDLGLFWKCIYDEIEADINLV